MAVLCPACIVLLGCPVCFTLYADTPALEPTRPEDGAPSDVVHRTDPEYDDRSGAVPPRGQEDGHDA